MVEVSSLWQFVALFLCAQIQPLLSFFRGTSSIERMAGQDQMSVMGHLVMPPDFFVFLCYCDKTWQWTIFVSLCFKALTWVPAHVLWLWSFLLSAQIASCQWAMWCWKMDQQVHSLHNCATFFSMKIHRWWVSVSDVYRNTVQIAEILREVWSWYSVPCYKSNFSDFFESISQNRQFSSSFLESYK